MTVLHEVNREAVRDRADPTQPRPEPISTNSPLGAERGQREHGHADGHVLGGLAEFAYEFAVRPRLDRVHGGRERHARDDHQQVAQCQAQYVRVGHVAHAPVPDEHQHERAVAENAHDEYHGEHHGHDVRLRPVRVRHVLVVVERVGHRGRCYLGRVHWLLAVTRRDGRDLTAAVQLLRRCWLTAAVKRTAK